VPAAESRKGQARVALTMQRTARGFGMQITASGHVTGYASELGAAELAGVPVPSRVVSVDGAAVRGKAQIGAALSTAGSAVAFVFLTRDDPRAMCAEAAESQAQAAEADAAAEAWLGEDQVRRRHAAEPPSHARVWPSCELAPGVPARVRRPAPHGGHGLQPRAAGVHPCPPCPALPHSRRRGASPWALSLLGRTLY
jgi:hypothetical protein